MRWFWGTAFVLAGLAYLAHNLGLISGSNIINLLQFWPVLLILYGTSLIFNHVKFGWIPTLIVYIISIAFICFSLKNGTFNKNTDNRGRTVNNFSSEMNADIKDAGLTINTGAVDLKAKSTSANLISGSMESDYLKPDLKVTKHGSSADVTLDTNPHDFLWPKGENDLSVYITDQIPVSLTLNAGASKIDLDLKEIQLSGLTLNAGAADTTVTIGDKIQNNTEINVSSGASKFSIEFPNSVGVKLVNQSPVSALHIDGFDNKGGKNYESKNYSEKEVKVELNISAGVSDITVSFE